MAIRRKQMSIEDAVWEMAQALRELAVALRDPDAPLGIGAPMAPDKDFAEQVASVQTKEPPQTVTMKTKEKSVAQQAADERKSIKAALDHLGVEYGKKTSTKKLKEMLVEAKNLAPEAAEATVEATQKPAVAAPTPVVEAEPVEPKGNKELFDEVSNLLLDYATENGMDVATGILTELGVTELKALGPDGWQKVKERIQGL